MLQHPILHATLRHTTPHHTTPHNTTMEMMYIIILTVWFAYDDSLSFAWRTQVRITSLLLAIPTSMIAYIAIALLPPLPIVVQVMYLLITSYQFVWHRRNITKRAWKWSPGHKDPTERWHLYFLQDPVWDLKKLMWSYHYGSIPISILTEEAVPPTLIMSVVWLVTIYMEIGPLFIITFQVCHNVYSSFDLYIFFGSKNATWYAVKAASRFVLNMLCLAPILQAYNIFLQKPSPQRCTLQQLHNFKKAFATAMSQIVKDRDNPTEKDVIGLLKVIRSGNYDDLTQVCV